MAKRDKLYTVNKWNRPFFEQERRRKLYLWGGDSANPIYGLKTGQAGLRWGYGDTGGTDYTAPVSNLAKQNSLDRAVTTFNQYSNPSYYQDIARTNYVYGWDKPLYGGVSDNSSTSNPPEYKVESYNPNWLDNISKITNGITNTAKTAIDAVNTTNTINSQIDSLSSAASNTPKFLQGVTAPLSNTLMKSNMDKMASDFGKTLNDLSTLKITDNSGLKHLSLNPDSVTKPGGISNIGKAGVGIGASILGEVGGNLISDGFSTVPGTLINQIGSAAGTVLSMIPGVGWVWGPAVTLGSKLLGGLYNRAFGSEYKDNGATAYTNQLNALNPNGSNEYLANLMASVGLGPQATSRNGWLNHSAERKADRTNAAQDLALNRFQRGVRNAFGNNNWNQLQYALNDYTTYGAMGGRIKRKKCNCKATGGFLNNAMLDSASATGYNFLSDLTNMQMQNNQNKQDMGSSLGNSFTGLSNGTLFANGGGIHINPAHKGEFTAKAKRHGMGVQQFANYVLAHKDKFPTSTIRQAVFAKNSNTWKKAFGGKLNYGKDKDIRDSGFFDGQTLYAIGGPLQAMSSNWSPGGNVTEINAGGQHEENPYEGVQVGVDPEGTPNLVEENEVIWNDYVFSNRLKVPKEVCKELRVGQKKDGFTFAEVAKKLLKESKERPNDPISKRGLDANMQKLEDAQEELKQKMEAEEAVEQFNSLPPEQQVAIMQQEGEKAQDAVAQEQMAQQIQNLPPEQQQAIAQQMAMEQAQQQGMPQQGMSPEEQYAMQQQAVQDQYAAQRDARNQEVLAQAAAMQDQAINSSAMGGKLYQSGGKKYIKGAKSHWETNAQGHRVLVPNTPFENTGFGGGRFGMAGGGAEWGDEPAPLAPKKRDWLAIDYKESFNDAYRKARKEKKKTFWFDGKEYSTDYNPNLTEEQVRQGMNRYQDKGLIIAPWEHAYGGPLCFGGKLFAEGGELNAQPQTEPEATEQPVDTEMAKYSDEELQDMIDDYQEAESGEVKVTKGKLARLRKKAEKAQAELERRHAEENEEQPQEARQEPSQEELQAAAMAQAQAAQQPIEGQPQEDMPQEGMSPEQAMMQQQMAGQMGQGSPEEMAAMEQQGQYGYGGRLYLTGGQLLNMFGFPTISAAEKAGWTPEDFGITSWFDTIDNSVVNNIISNGTARWLDPKFVNENTIPNEDYRLAFNNYNYNPFSPVKTPDSYTWYEPGDGNPAAYSRPHFTNNGSWQQFYGENPTRNTIVNESVYKALTDAYKSLNGLKFRDNLTLGELDDYMKNSADWKARQDWLWTHQDAAEHRLKYLADIARNNEDNKGKLKGADKFSAQNIYDFKKLKDGTYEVSLKQGKNANDERTWWDAVTGDLKYGDMYNAPHVPDTRNVYIDRDTGEVLTAEPGKDSGYTLVGNPLSSYVTATTDNPNDYNQTIRFYTKKGNDNNGNSNSNNPDFSELEPIRNDADVDWSGLGFAAAGPLMGLSLQYAMGKPDMSELDKAVAAYERNTGTMIAPHLTHGLIRPAIIDPRVVSNSMNQSRLGTNRLLMNTGASPSRGATILANDANSINQLGQAMIENWKANRAQEQAAATFNRETNTTNANILNQVDQFNAQTQASLANTAAQMRYNAAKEALDQNNAWKAGLIQNIGGLGKGIYDYWKDQQNVKQRDMLAELLFPMNDDWARQHHISYVDPVTGLVRRGENKGKYYVETADGKRQYLPYATINDINGETGITLSLGKKKSNGGKLKKKRKGYTF